MVATPQKYRNPRQGYYTDLGVDTTPVGAIVYNLKSGQNTFDHSYINDLSRHDRLSEVTGTAYLGGVDDPAYTHEGYLYCNGVEHYIKDYPGLYEIIGNKYGGLASIGVDITNSGQIKTFTTNAAYNSSRPAGTYYVNGVTTAGNGTGASFKVVVPSTGSAAPTVTLEFPGKGYVATDTIKLGNSYIGSVGGVADIIVTVITIEGGGGSGYVAGTNLLFSAPAGVTWSNLLTAGTGSPLTPTAGFDAANTTGRSEGVNGLTITFGNPITLKNGDKVQVFDTTGTTNTKTRAFAPGPVQWSNYLKAGVDGVAGVGGGTGQGEEHIVKTPDAGFDATTSTGRSVGEYGLTLDLPVGIRLFTGDKVQVLDPTGATNTKTRADTGTWSNYVNHHATDWVTVVTGSTTITELKKLYAIRYDTNGRDAGWAGVRIQNAAGVNTFLIDGQNPPNYNSTTWALGTAQDYVNHGAGWTTVYTGNTFGNRLTKLETIRYDTDVNIVNAWNSTTNTITIPSHGAETGDETRYLKSLTGGNLDPLVNGTTYYIVKVDNNTAKLATSLVNAQANPPVVIDIQNTSSGQAHGFRFNNRKAGWMGIRVQDSAGVNTALIDNNMPPNPGDTHIQAQGEIKSVDANGAITGFTITNFGKGYSSPPTVSFTGGTGAQAVVRINSETGAIQQINQSNVLEHYGDLYLGTFKVPDLIAKKVVGNGPVYGDNSPTIGNSPMGVGASGGKWYLDKASQDDYFSLGRIVTSGYANVSETISCTIIGSHTVKFTMREEDLSGVPQHNHTYYSTQPQSDQEIAKSSGDRYLRGYTLGRGKTVKWTPTDNGQKLTHKHGLVRRPNPDASVSTYDVWDWQGGAASVGSLQNPEIIKTVTASNIDTATDLITITGHGFSDGTAVEYLQGSAGAIGGLTNGVTYYVASGTTNNFKLATSAANATAATPITVDLTGTPSGSYTFTFPQLAGDLNYLATGSGGSWEFQVTVPAPDFLKFGATSEIGNRKKLLSSGTDIIDYPTANTVEYTSGGQQSPYSVPSTAKFIECTVIGGGGGGAAGSAAGSDGTASWVKFDSGSVLTITSNPGKGGFAAAINTGGAGGDGGTAAQSGSYSGGQFPGMVNGGDGGDGTGSKLFVGNPDNQASDPSTGGAGGQEIKVTGKGGGGNGINVKVGDAGSNVVFVPAGNGIFDFSSVGNNVTDVEFELQGAAGANSNVLPLHNYGTNVFGAGGNGEKLNITIKDTFLPNFKTKVWKAYLGGAAINASRGTINGTAGTASMYGGNGGAGSTTTNTNYWSISTDTWGGGGGAATHLYADTVLAAGAGGGGGGGSYGHADADVGGDALQPSLGSAGTTPLDAASGDNAAAAGCVGGGGGGGGGGVGPSGYQGGAAGGSGDAGGGGGAGGHAGGGGGERGVSAWNTTFFNSSGAASPDNTGAGSAKATISWDDAYWTPGGGGGGASGQIQAIVELESLGTSISSLTAFVGTGGAAGTVQSPDIGTPVPGEPGYVKIRAGIKVGESGATYTTSTGDVIESGSFDDDEWDVKIVNEGTGVGAGNGVFKCPTTQVPRVMFKGGGLADGDANHATATCTVSGGRVTAVTLTDGGTYAAGAEAPTVHIIDGCCGGAYVDVVFNSTSGEVTQLTFDDTKTYKYERFLKFGNHGPVTGTKTPDRNRWVVVNAVDCTNVSHFSVVAARGNNINGGKKPSQVLRAYYQKSGNSSWTEFGTLIDPDNQVTTDPFVKLDPTANDRIVPAIDTTTTSGNFDGDSGATKWYTYTLDLPEAAQSAATKIKLEQPMPNPNGSNDTDLDSQHYAIAQLIYWKPKTSGLVFVPNAGAVNKASVDSLSYTIEGGTGNNVTYTSGMQAEDATVELKSTTKIEPTASIDPDKDIPLIHTYKTCKYLIKAF
mgnify:CR=1 FL=1